MKGNNELHLCAAEMIQAMEFYLKAKVLQPEYAAKVRVESVTAEGDSYHSGFAVKLEAIEKAEIAIVA